MAISEALSCSGGGGGTNFRRLPQEGAALAPLTCFLEAARVDWLSTGQGPEAKARDNHSLSLSVRGGVGVNGRKALLPLSLL